MKFRIVSSVIVIISVIVLYVIVSVIRNSGSDSVVTEEVQQ